MAVSPPQGGTTHRIGGSHSIAVSSAARVPAGPDVIPLPAIASPTTTSNPAARSHCTQKAIRAAPDPSTPAEGAVTPMRSPSTRVCSRELDG